MLLAVLLYGYAVGQRSSRAIERLCSTDVAFRVLCAQDVPDHSRLARFRKDNEDVFADLFARVLMMCARAGMGRVGVVAIDGTKIAANAALGANRGEASLRRELEALEQAAKGAADRVVAEAAAVDAAEDEQYGSSERGMSWLPSSPIQPVALTRSAGQCRRSKPNRSGTRAGMTKPPLGPRSTYAPSRPGSREWAM